MEFSIEQDYFQLYVLSIVGSDSIAQQTVFGLGV